AVALVPRLVEVSGPAGPGTVTLSARAAREGRTTVEVPPLGEVSAPTHGSPLAVSPRLDGLQLDGVEALLDSGGAGLRDDVEPDLVALGREWALKALVAATVVGAAAGLMWPRRQRRARANVAFAASGALLAVGGLVASTVAGF